MLQSSICIQFPFHRVSLHTSIIFRILMCCTVRSHCCDWYRNLFAWLGSFVLSGILNLCRSHQIWHDGERVHVCVCERDGECERWALRVMMGRQEVGCGGIWQLLKKVREMETFGKALEGSKRVWGNEWGRGCKGNRRAKQVIKKSGVDKWEEEMEMAEGEEKRSEGKKWEEREMGEWGDEKERERESARGLIFNVINELWQSASNPLPTSKGEATQK